jgi:hypothetical protein
VFTAGKVPGNDGGEGLGQHGTTHFAVDTGVRLAIDGLTFARRYGSARHVSRVQRMYDRLQDTLIGSSARMRDLAEALRAA